MTCAVEPGAATLAGVRGREEDFRAFYSEHYPALAGYCWTLVGDRDLAHDLAQEAFTRMLARWLRVEEPRAYLYIVATNLARRAWRSRSRDAHTVLALGRDRVVDIAGPDAAAIGVRTAVGALPRRLREVVLLHYFADLPVNEVAQAVGRPAGTVKRQLSEARALLAGVLEPADG